MASCGNAALAAAVVAAAAGAALRVFVPPDADPVVLGRLEELGAHVEVCPRDGLPGDPTYRRLLEALEKGAVPFTCQGNLNGLAVEGGETLGWEIVSSGVLVDRLVVQVGGGALASACVHALREGVALGAVAAMPRIDTVQTEAAWPLRRAFDAIDARRPRAGGPLRLAPPLGVHVAVGGGAAEHRARDPGRRDLRLAGRGRGDARHGRPAARRRRGDARTCQRARAGDDGHRRRPDGLRGAGRPARAARRRRASTRTNASQSCSPESCERLRPRGETR